MFNKKPFFHIRTNSIPKDFTHNVFVKTLENFDNAIMSEIIKIAKEQGYTDLMLINKEFVVEALKREMARRELNG